MVRKLKKLSEDDRANIRFQCPPNQLPPTLMCCKYAPDLHIYIWSVVRIVSVYLSSCSSAYTMLAPVGATKPLSGPPSPNIPLVSRDQVAPTVKSRRPRSLSGGVTQGRSNYMLSARTYQI